MLRDCEEPVGIAIKEPLRHDESGILAEILKIQLILLILCFLVQN